MIAADRLGVPPEELTQGACPALDTWRAGLAPRGITLIFPEAFMNNPASMFGHTLLRLDVADPSEPRNLLAYAIDFTANTQGDGGSPCWHRQSGPHRKNVRGAVRRCHRQD